MRSSTEIGVSRSGVDIPALISSGPDERGLEKTRRKEQADHDLRVVTEKHAKDAVRKANDQERQRKLAAIVPRLDLDALMNIPITVPEIEAQLE